MYSESQTYFRDVPVSVTMEDDPKHQRDGHGSNGNGSDTDQEPGGGPRILQVTMAAEGKEEGSTESITAPKPDTVRRGSIGSNSVDDEYVLQPPSAAMGDKGLELQIQRDFDGLSEKERQQVYFDMRGEIFKAEPRTESGSSSSSFALMEGMSKTVDSPVSDSELQSLDQELHLILNNPEEQESNPFFQTIKTTLSSSGSDCYANSPGLRSKLLRAEHRDPKKAARRTAEYLTLLCELFGETLLSRPIRLSDLSASERQLQRKGYQQLFRFRDQSQHKQNSEKQQPPQNDQQPNSLQELLGTGGGRRIAGSFDLCRCVNTTEPAIDDYTAKTRVLLYLMQVASDDEETQTQGIVFIFMLALRAVLSSLPSSCPPASSSIPVPESQQQQQPPASSSSSLPRSESDNIFANDSTSESDTNNSDEQLLAQLQFSPHESTNKHNHTMNRVRVLGKVFRCGPLRVSSIHVCSPSRPELHQIKMDFLKALSKHERVRTRFHNGTSMECSLSLNKVGIPTDRLPLKYDGTIKTEDHLQWIAIQEAKESAAKHKRAFDIVECPMNMDILSGRGQLVRSHPGNVSFRKDFIRARSVRYDMASNREEKNTIADEILEDISTLKRKFLKQHQGAGYWTELDKKTAKEKVMMAFREFRKSQRNQQQQQQLRKARSNPQLQQAGLHQARPSLPLSQSLPHSPVTQPPGQQRRSEARSPSIPMSGSQKSLHGHEGAQSQQPEQPPQGSIHYQLYPPPNGSVPGIPSEGFHPPPHHIAAAGLAPPSMPYYPPHPPIPPHLGYGHPIPPHLLPPPHHRAYPPNPHEDQASGRNMPPSGGAPGSDRPEPAVPGAPIAYMGSTSTSPVPPAPPSSLINYYHHHHPGYYPASNPEPGQNRSTRKGDDGEGDERRYKRYKHG